MVPKDNHDVFVGQTDSRGENMPLLPHLKQKNCIMDYDKVHGGMMYLCCDDILWARSSLGALK